MALIHKKASSKTTKFDKLETLELESSQIFESIAELSGCVQSAAQNSIL